jgi:hypothetical protein
MNFELIKQKSQQLRNKFLQSFRQTSKQVVKKIAGGTWERAEEATEESIIFAVDRALDIVEIASQRVRERNIPTENVSLEISISIVGVADLKMQVNVPKSDEIKTDA